MFSVLEVFQVLSSDVQVNFLSLRSLLLISNHAILFLIILIIIVMQGQKKPKHNLT